MNFSGLRRVEILLFVAILVQSLAIIILYLYEFASQPEVATLNADEEPELAKARDNVDDANSAVSLEGLSEPLGVHHTTPNPGGLILSASFSYRQDPREVNRRKPLPHILPTFENIYHYHTTVLQQGLHAIIFHDDYSFNETFVKKYTSEHIKFVRVEAPTFDHGEPIISPNDFRYVVFDRWLKANSEQDDKGQVIVNGINYGWYMISDLDMIFQRNPFPKLDGYAKLQNVSFFGSYDGGTWENEQMRLQRRLFRNCYGRPMLLTWRDDVEWSTPNGNCGLWAGRFDEVSCILDCMAKQYDVPPVRGKGGTTICDMATHDYCVHYGGCFPGSNKGVYDDKKVGVLWGEASMGENNDLFGPPYGRNKQCDRDTWTVMHNRCDWKGPLCFRKDERGELVKYHQNIRGRKCRLDPNTDLPLDDLETKDR
mmetsp:Transcript_11222/g.19721  ORF Transcript_11222/g.19721 Transcript_11222/m.19721 type:complete len:426 (-) Transcript_11222:263-1540(-)